jgi:hypothetical protein
MELQANCKPIIAGTGGELASARKLKLSEGTQADSKSVRDISIAPYSAAGVIS